MIRLGLAVATLLCASPAMAAPTQEDVEAAAQILRQASELRTPYLTGDSNPYAVSKNPKNRFEVQVLSWDVMKRRLAGAAVQDGVAVYNQGWNDAVSQVVVPARR